MGNFLHHYDDHCLKKAPDDESGANGFCKEKVKMIKVILFSFLLYLIVYLTRQT